MMIGRQLSGSEFEILVATTDKKSQPSIDETAR